MMGKNLDLIINRAVKKANQLKHEYLTLEEIFWSLLQDDQVKEILHQCGGDVAEFEREIEVFLAQHDNFSILTPEQIETLATDQFASDEIRKRASEEGIFYQPEISQALQRVLQRAALHVQSSGKKQINGINLLVALFHEKESYAYYLLTNKGIDKFKLLQTIAHGVDSPITATESPEETKRGSALETFTVNLNELAQRKEIDPLVGRVQEIEAIVRVLCRRNKNNPLLVGDSGVGKTAIAEGLAWVIVNNKAPAALQNAQLYSLQMSSLLAGARYRGDFEERFKAVINELEQQARDGKWVVLVIDELHTVMGAGSSGTGSMDASNLLRPMLKGQVRCLGSTTHEEYRKFIEKDRGFSRRFQKIEINEPTAEESYQILLGIKERFETYHGVKYSNAILKTVIRLSERYITDQHLPDKAIDIMDEAGALMQLLPANQRRSKITSKDIELVVSKMAKLPQLTVASDEKGMLQSLSANIKSFIFGQDQAIESVVDAVLLARSGLSKMEGPQGCFLFTGPTGVGKTELARQLAYHLGIHFERFDMSEYMEKHSVAKLIGAPPGYIGYESGGLLTDAIKKSPYCVLLLDEIEKAHADIFNILLQVMDHGTLTDSQGRFSDFRNVILIMTTNAGAKELDAGAIGLGENIADSSISRMEKVIKHIFSPEFRNRLDKIVRFNRLSHENILRIVEKFLKEVSNGLQERKIELIVDQQVKNWLAKEGFDPQMGARPIERLINNEIKHHLSREILFGKLEKGGRVRAFLENGKINFTFE